MFAFVVVLVVVVVLVAELVVVVVVVRQRAYLLRHHCNCYSSFVLHIVLLDIFMILLLLYSGHPRACVVDALPNPSFEPKTQQWLFGLQSESALPYLCSFGPKIGGFGPKRPKNPFKPANRRDMVYLNWLKLIHSTSGVVSLCQQPLRCSLTPRNVQRPPPPPKNVPRSPGMCANWPWR